MLDKSWDLKWGLGWLICPIILPDNCNVNVGLYDCVVLRLSGLLHHYSDEIFVYISDYRTHKYPGKAGRCITPCKLRILQI